MNRIAISLKRQWRVPVLAALAAVLFAVAFAASATLDRVEAAGARLFMTRLSTNQPASTPFAVATSEVMRNRI